MFYFCVLMNVTETELLKETLADDFGLAVNDLVSKEKDHYCAYLARRSISIAGNPDQLFSMLYRLDISERKIKEAMATEEEVTKKLPF